MGHQHSQWSEDYLVSDKSFSHPGETMKSFRSDVIQESPPNTIKEVIPSILQKVAIKRGKNTEGSELFDGEEMEGKVKQDEEVDVIELLETLQSIETILI